MIIFLNLVYQVAVLALVVLGLAIVFGQLGIMNMAHGEFVMIGAYSVVYAQTLGWPLWAAFLVALAVSAAIGLVVNTLLIQRLAGRPFDTFLATWGLSALIRTAVEISFGRGFQSIEYGIGGIAQIAGVSYPMYRLGLIGVVALGLIALAAWYSRSTAGARLRAMVANPTLAQAVGLNTRRLASGAFVAGTMCAGLAGAALAPIVRVEPGMGVDYLLTSFFVLVVGGLGSVAGLIAGSSFIGIAQSLGAAVIDQTFGYLTVLVLSICFLWLRPYGLVKQS